MNYKDYYAVMGVARDATQDEIKRAYRKLARKYHPDVSKESDAEQRFKELGEAYEVLKDPEKRAAYDQLGSDWRAGQDFKPPPGWDAGFEFSGGGYTEADQAAFSDFFESLFGRGGQFHEGGFSRARRPSGRGEDHHSRIEVTLEDAYNGAVRGIQLRVPEYDAQGRLSYKQRTLQVKIPKGVTAGKRIRLAGQGGPGFNGGPAGDLFLEVEFAPHPRFQVEGKDIFTTVPIAPWEAALGAKVNVPTLGGTVGLSVPAGARSGQKLRLKGRGLPVPGGAPGDQYAVLQVVVPPADTDDKKALYEKMAQEMAFDPRAQLGG
ncbi:DnaJ C-terminal domain-containing protein [Thiosocius teredinicola]|uniref:DnaJ C-terminal domain-containing protein n=1 Tax=Thiosocius teredinicola TaxID=1973002 RepID=UPI000990DB60